MKSEITPNSTWYTNLGSPVMVLAINDGMVYYSHTCGNDGLADSSHNVSDFLFYFKR